MTTAIPEDDVELWLLAEAVAKESCPYLWDGRLANELRKRKVFTEAGQMETALNRRQGKEIDNAIRILEAARRLQRGTT